MQTKLFGVLLPKTSKLPLNITSFEEYWLTQKDLKKNNVITIDSLCQRYGILPSEFLKKPKHEQDISMYIAIIGSDHEQKQIDNQSRKK